MYPPHPSRGKIKLYCSRSMCLGLGWEYLYISFLNAKLLIEEYCYLWMDSPKSYQTKKACWGEQKERQGKDSVLRV